MAGVQGRTQRSQGRRQQERGTAGAWGPLASVFCVTAGLGPAAAAADNTVRIRWLVRQFKFGRRGEGEWRVEPGWKGQRARLLCRRGFFVLSRAAVAAALDGVVVVVIFGVVDVAAVAGGCGIDVVRRPCRGGVPAMFTLFSVTVLLVLLLLLVLVLSAMLLLVNNTRKSSEHKYVRVRSDQGSD
jgi:hypothetical protein